jgi:hypothetical protein
MGFEPSINYRIKLLGIARLAHLSSASSITDSIRIVETIPTLAAIT